jgi:hypothetical protein
MTAVTRLFDQKGYGIGSRGAVRSDVSADRGAGTGRVLTDKKNKRNTPGVLDRGLSV